MPLLGIGDNSAPKQSDHLKGTVVAMNGRASKLDQRSANVFIGRKIKFAGAVIAKLSRCRHSCLQPIGSNYFTRAGVLNQKMIAGLVEAVAITSIFISGSQAFV